MADVQFARQVWLTGRGRQLPKFREGAHCQVVNTRVV